MTDEADESATPSPGNRTSDMREIVSVPSGIRSAKLDASWLDTLLSLAIALPVERGATIVIKEALDRLEMLFPHLALGVCIVDSDAGEQLIETRVPPGSARAADHDPSRLFAAFAHERMYLLGEELDGSTFHMAGDVDSLTDPLSTECLVGERFAALLSSAIRRASHMERALATSNELRQLQSQMIQAEKLASLGQIAAGVVHELNNPLTSIIAYSDFLSRRLASGRVEEADIERVQRINEAAQRIQKFSRDLVAYARPAGDVPGPVLLHEVIDKALVFCEHEFVENGVNVDRDLYEGLPLVRGIAGQLTQVFVNLFTNAAHAMTSSGGALVVRTRPGDTADWVKVEVIDEGHGIEAAHINQIFEPFFTTKTDGRGTGLGLAIVRGIIAAHGGTLVASSVPDRGAVFCLTLPSAPRPATTRPPPRSK
jgi:signal transduction histidine kinase